MPIQILCPNPACRAGASVPDGLGGKSVKCKRCGTAFVARPTADARQSDTRPLSAGAEDPFPSLPATFGRYRVLRLLGKGGMGAVYLAEDTELGRKVALKLPSFGPGAPPTRVDRFLREARAAAALHHPHICTIFDVGREGGRPYLTMAYVEGRPLADAIDPDRPVPERQAAIWARQLALALAHAHDRGVIHRDLKPANVMLTAGGDPVVMDFGLAKRLAEEDTEAKLTREGAVIGTPSYMAPEQVRGESAAIGPRTDVYALGAMLYELLTGRTPFEGPVGVVLANVLTGKVPAVKDVRRDVDPRLDAVCRKAMAKDPSDRFPTTAAFADALSEYLNAPLASPALPPTITEVRPGPPPLPPTVTKDARAPVFDLEVGDPKKPRARRRRMTLPQRWGLWAGIGAMVLGAVAVIVVLLTVRTRYGEVVIELSDPAAKVEVKVDGERIDIAGLDRPISFKAGEHGLTVTGQDFETVTRSFTVKKGEREVVKVTLTPVAGVGKGGGPGGDDGGPKSGQPGRVPDGLTAKEGDARDKAIAWLKGDQSKWAREVGDWERVGSALPTGGPTALALLALLENGVGPDDPVVARGLNYLRTVEPERVYVVALQTQVYCAADRPEDADRIKANVRWLEKAAANDGPRLLGWSYTDQPAGRTDVSCTRYAVAALAAANRAGYLVTDLGLWDKVRNLFHRTQVPGGGWRYTETHPEPDSQPTHTMTASGALCMVLAAQAMPPGDAEADPVFAAGMSWLAEHFEFDRKNTFYHLDVLAALGRARGMRMLGAGATARDWFKEGSDSLLWAQRSDGRFVGEGAEANPVIATAFALRFLASRPAGPKAERPRARLPDSELVALTSLPGGQNKSGPWLSANGRSLYWADKQEAKHWIWRADRKGPGQPFETWARMFTGHDLTQSGDMTEFILVDHDPEAGENKFALFSARKARPTDVALSSWRKLDELSGYGFVAAPCLTADGLTLYAEQFGDRSLPPNVRFRRADRASPWGKAEAVPIRGLEKGTLRFPFISPDGRYLFGNNDVSPSGMVMLTSSDGGKSFGSPRAIEVPGKAVKGKFPRYAPDSNELFFGDSVNTSPSELYLIRNFDPERDTRPVK